LIWFLAVGLLVLLALNVPVAFAMLATSIIYLLVLQEVPLIVVAQQVAAGTDKFLLLAIPFFFLAAEFMSTGGIMHRLVELARAIVGHLRGGLGQVNVLASMMFAGMSGSAVADAAGMGRIEIEMMHRSGYDRGFSGAVTAASATIGPVIPPSIPFVVYGSLANVSIGKLFLAGIFPGVAMGVFLMGAVWVLAGRRNFPTSEWAGFHYLARQFVHSLPVLALPVIILGGIFSGVFTATESAVVAAAYALVIGLLLRELHPADIVRVLLRVGTDTARIMLIVVSATLYSWILAREGAPQALTAAVLSLTTEPWLLLALINLLLLLLGCFMEPLPIMVIVVPNMLPLVQTLGIDLTHFGVIVTLNLMIGLITPPIGLVMFTVMDITKIPLDRFTREIWPFLVALVLVLILVTYLPGLVLLLPEMIYGP
jgi:tripartite ATP-independent transporter DctM subunit